MPILPYHSLFLIYYNHIHHLYRTRTSDFTRFLNDNLVLSIREKLYEDPLMLFRFMSERIKTDLFGSESQQH